jgi:hypothetical protein
MPVEALSQTGATRQIQLSVSEVSRLETGTLKSNVRRSWSFCPRTGIPVRAGKVRVGSMGYQVFRVGSPALNTGKSVMSWVWPSG